jgi:hypothetical protein
MLYAMHKFRGDVDAERQYMDDFVCIASPDAAKCQEMRKCGVKCTNRVDYGSMMCCHHHKSDMPDHEKEWAAMCTHAGSTRGKIDASSAIVHKNALDCLHEMTEADLDELFDGMN